MRVKGKAHPSYILLSLSHSDKERTTTNYTLASADVIVFIYSTNYCSILNRGLFWLALTDSAAQLVSVREELCTSP